MKTNQKLKELFTELPPDAQSRLLDGLLVEHELKGSVLLAAQQDVLATRKKKPCPHCKSANVYKRGKQKGVQMYQCKECVKWYSETTGTTLYKIKLKSKWQSYIGCMEQGMPIKTIAKEIGISIQTSFDWRHKILRSLGQYIPETMADHVECDEIGAGTEQQRREELK